MLSAALRDAREVTGASGSEPPQELAAKWEAEQLPGQKEAIEVKIAELETQAEAMDIRVFHENMFFKKKISATHHASAWGLV